MRNFRKKRIWKDVLQSKPVLIFLGIVILFFTWNILILWSKMGETSKNKKIIEDKVAQLKLQKEKLSADIQSLNTDQGKERIFRENFGLVKEGEDLIVVVDDKNLPEIPVSAPAPGFFSFLKNLFE